jgi:hypothetical protein
LNDNFQTLSNDYGDYTQIANSIYLNVTARPRSGLVLQGRLQLGNTGTDYCDVRTTIPEWTVLGAQSPTNPWCDTSSGWLTRVTGLGTYTIPKVDVLVAGTFRSDQGVSLAANWAAPNSATVGLNRPYAGVAGTTVTVNLVEPGTLFGDSHQPVRHAIRQDPALRTDTRQCRRGSLQRRERCTGAGLQPDVRAERSMAGADVSAPAAVCEI